MSFTGRLTALLGRASYMNHCSTHCHSCSAKTSALQEVLSD